MLTQLFGRSLALAALFAATTLVIGIALALILLQVLGNAALDDAACRLGLSQDCLASELQESRAEIAALEARKQDLEALYERLSRLDYASESFVVFYRDSGRPSVVTGLQYKSLIEPGQFDSGWCYIDLPRRGGVVQNLYIARMTAGGDIKHDALGNGALSSAGLDRADVDDARRRCRWPDRTS